MSIKHMLQAFESEVGSASRKLVLLKLADNANDEGKCWPSYQHIADHCEMSRRSVMRHVRHLVEAGLVSVSHRKTDKGNSSNVFQLITPSDSLALPSDNVSPPSDNVSPPSDNVSPPPSDNLSPRTCHSFEPVNEPMSFSLFWERYPKKTEKARAERKWNEFNNATREDALNGIANFLAGKEYKYTCGAAVYLTGKRWEDESQNDSGNLDNYMAGVR